jgi:hypothetical protein
MDAAMKRLTDPDFVWIPSQSHDADSRPFYERQMKRIKEANEARQRDAAEKQQKVTTIKRGSK